ncbi:MAG TPA: RsmE family RNA methyltransferase, partial [Vicinamibacterales bacterium]
MLPRFLGAIDDESATARLDADETRHLAHVLRLGIGEEVTVFDGAGREFRARVERVTRDGAELALIEASDPAPEPAVRVTLAQAALKGEKMDDVVRDATMMGVAVIEPVITAHTIAHLKPGSTPERWRRIAVASAKQCRR